jgi:group I intron endonuclease
MSEVQEILYNTDIAIKDRIDKTIVLLDDFERYRCLDSKFRIVYLTVNCINGKKYIGQHTTIKLNDTYFGSGAVLLKALKKYGKENFEKGILDYATDQDDLNKKELYWILFMQERYDCYNLTTEPYKKITTEEEKRKSSERQKGGTPWNKGLTGIYSEYTLDRIRQSKLGTIQTEESNQKRSAKLLGKTFSKEHNDKISIAFTGRSITWGDKISKTLTGVDQPKEVTEKRINTLLNLPKIICPNCGYVGKYMKNMQKWHFDNCKKKPRYFRTIF